MIKIMNFFREWISETKITYTEVVLIAMIIFPVASLIVACQMFVIAMIDTIFNTQVYDIVDNIVTPATLIGVFILIIGMLGWLLHDVITDFKKK